jgi:hypothetical protein
MSRHKGLNQPQLAALGEVTKLCDRGELVVELRGGLDGSVLATVRDRWAVEHYHVDTLGTLTRPVHTGARSPKAVSTV